MRKEGNEDEASDVRAVNNSGPDDKKKQTADEQVGQGTARGPVMVRVKVDE